MSLLSRLFGRKSDPSSPPAGARSEEYKGFAITPAPIKEGGQYRVAARIEKDGRGHDLVRADQTASLEDATAISLSKAKQMIDEQGDRLFGP
ncbi:MAG: hypothetical protein J0L76_10730 [Rhodobacterales bacterium]|nr:hypothetical protein [Rhodobacterales bacterium]